MKDVSPDVTIHKADGKDNPFANHEGGDEGGSDVFGGFSVRFDDILNALDSYEDEEPSDHKDPGQEKESTVAKRISINRAASFSTLMMQKTSKRRAQYVYKVITEDLPKALGSWQEAVAKDDMSDHGDLFAIFPLATTLCQASKKRF